jgi:Holliday junction DNA helicase RuvA
VKLYIYEGIREDAYILYGFSTKQERELFLLLITVSGIGGNTARMILSALSPSELCNVISSGNDKLLKTVKGIGLKTAQRIIVDLKDKIPTIETETISGNAVKISPIHTEIYEEAVAALTMLGFPQAPSQKVVTSILKEEPDLTVEKVIKLALKRL